MKKLLLLFIIIISATNLFAQKSNIICYTENGERFYLVLNGVRQNEKAETNVKVTDLTQPTYKAKIIFEDQTFGQFDKTLYFEQATETVFAIKQNKSKEWVMRFQSSVPIAEAAPPAPNQTVIIYGSPAPAPAPNY